MLTLLAKCLKILNSEIEPGQISLALCFSMLMGLTPLFSLHNVFVLFAVLFIRVNLSAFLLGWGMFSLMAYLLDPLFHSLGLIVLSAPVFQGLFTILYNIPIARVSGFNNSIVMGSLVFSLVLFVPSYIVFKILITRYRVDLLSWVQKVKLVQILKTSKLFSIYESLS
ncbi:MAG: TIGR03546 family protein [Proteobacteria bacterium]|nr:TIGR03546 family protein [Pseudomonadota bacterium]